MKELERERLAVIENEVKGIKDSVKSHCAEQRKDFDKVFEKLDLMEERHETKLEQLKKEFASKWVEKISIGSLIIVVGGVIVWIITNIPK